MERILVMDECFEKSKWKVSSYRPAFQMTRVSDAVTTVGATPAVQHSIGRQQPERSKRTKMRHFMCPAARSGWNKNGALHMEPRVHTVSLTRHLNVAWGSIPANQLYKFPPP